MRKPEEIAAKLAYVLYTLTDCLSESRHCLESVARDTSISEDEKQRFDVEAESLRKACRSGDYAKIREILRERHDIVNQALRCVYNLCRCDNLPQRIDAFASIAAEDLTSAILFYVSKADRRSYSQVYQVLSQLYHTYSSGEEIDCKHVESVVDGQAADITKIVSKECRDEGYSTILALISIGLRELGVARNHLSSLKDLVGFVASSIKTLMPYRDIIESYIVGLKRLLKGYYG